MKSKFPLLVLLGAATLVIVGCGDKNDPRLSDNDVRCLKIQQLGGTCGPTSTSTGTSTTVTTTSSSTATETVTLTQTSTSS